MNTIWTATSAYGLQATYIDNRNFPGGPFAYLQIEFSTPANVLSLASYIIGNVLADALLVRVHVPFRGEVVYSLLQSSGDVMSSGPPPLAQH